MDVSQFRKITSIASSAASANITMDYFLNLSPDQLKSHEFTLINFEYAVAEKGKYYPCEVGVLKFTIAGGISEMHHAFVQPRPLPPGTNAEAKMHSDETHMIPILGDFDFWDDDYGGLLVTVDALTPKPPNFIFGVGSTTNVKALPGSKESTYAETNGCLNQLLEKANNVMFGAKIFPAEQLGKLLVQKIGGCTAAEAPKVLAQYMQRTKHDFDPNVQCYYHEKVESLRCARAAVVRFYMNLIDMLYELRGGQMDVRLLHVPDNCFSVEPSAVAVAVSQKKPLKAARNAGDITAGKPQIGFGKMTPVLAQGQNRRGPLTSSTESENWRRSLKAVSTPLMQDRIVTIGRSKIADVVVEQQADRLATNLEVIEEERSESSTTSQPPTVVGQAPIEHDSASSEIVYGVRRPPIFCPLPPPPAEWLSASVFASENGLEQADQLSGYYQ